MTHHKLLYRESRGAVFFFQQRGRGGEGVFFNLYVICKYAHLHTQLDSVVSLSLRADSGGESMTTTKESILCHLAPEVAAEPRFCTEKFDHEKTVVTLDSFSKKSLINLNNVLLRFLIRRARDGIYHFLRFMTVGVMHGISKELPISLVNLFMRRKLT